MGVDAIVDIFLSSPQGLMRPGLWPMYHFELTGRASHKPRTSMADAVETPCSSMATAASSVNFDISGWRELRELWGEDSPECAEICFLGSLSADCSESYKGSNSDPRSYAKSWKLDFLKHWSSLCWLESIASLLPVFVYKPYARKSSVYNFLSSKEWHSRIGPTHVLLLLTHVVLTLSRADVKFSEVMWVGLMFEQIKLAWHSM